MVDLCARMQQKEGRVNLGLPAECHRHLLQVKSHSRSLIPPPIPSPESPEGKNNENTGNDAGLPASGSFGNHSCLGAYSWMLSEVWIRQSVPVLVPSNIIHFLGAGRFSLVRGPCLSCCIKRRAVAGDVNELAGL